MLNFKIVESQKLIFSKGPVVAADTTNLEAKFEVNDLFDGTLRAYWNVRGSAVDSFAVDLDASGTCTIPSEVLASISDPSMYGDIDHILQVSVVSIGDDDTIRITSTTCEIPVYKSSYSGNVSQPSKPNGGGSVTNIITGAAINGEQMDFYNGNNVIFSTSLANLKNFLLSIAGGTMQGDINMDGHAITGLPNAVNDSDALALAFAKTLFVPYNQIKYSVTVNTNDELYAALDVFTNKLENGEQGTMRVGVDASGLDLSGGTWFVTICRTKETYATLTGICYSGAGTVVYNWLRAGAWSGFEYLNPPMTLGVEYRTTERINGSAVYKKVANFGTLPNTSPKSVAHGITNVSKFIEVDLLNMSGSSSLTNYTQIDALYADGTNITIRTLSDLSSITVYAILSYIKSN